MIRGEGEAVRLLKGSEVSEGGRKEANGTAWSENGDSRSESDTAVGAR